jgi:hypothetical protein
MRHHRSPRLHTNASFLVEFPVVKIICSRLDVSIAPFPILDVDLLTGENKSRLDDSGVDIAYLICGT